MTKDAPTGTGENAGTRRAGSPDEATEHTRSRYNTAAPLYDLMEWPAEQWLYRPWRRQLWAGVEGPEVLELGVGTGKNIPYYPDGARVTAIDLSPRMLARARRAARGYPARRVTLLEMDAQKLDFPDDAFDAVVGTFVFCSVPDPVQGLREALRVTKPGGRLRLLEHMRARPPWLARLMDALDRPVHRLTGVHIARETARNVRRAGWAVDDATALSWADVFRRIEAHKSGGAPDKKLNRLISRFQRPFGARLLPPRTDKGGITRSFSAPMTSSPRKLSTFPFTRNRTPRL